MINRSILAVLFSVGLAAVSTDALALSKTEAKAEQVRLSEDMRRLAKRGQWRGVNRSYDAIRSLERKGVVLTFDEHYLGAQAAREMGNVTRVYRRLLRAKDVEAKSEVTNWIADILRQYGEVDLIIPDRYKGEANLAVAVMPLQPDQRSTIGMAQQRVTEGKSYDGLLPGGEYTFGPHTFTVKPGGDTIVLEVSKKGPGTVSKRKAGEKGPFRFAYVGPRADIGLGWTQATDSGSGVGPGSYGGLGARGSLGVEAGLSGPLAVVLDLGYQGLSGSPSDASGELSNVPGFQIENDQMHMFFVWLAAAIDFGPFDVAAGPMYGFGSGSVTGVAQDCIDTGSCQSVSSADTSTLRHSQLEGSINAAGGAVALTYDVVEFGQFAGSISLNTGALSDGSSWYPFGTLGFSVGPVGQEDE